MSGGLVRAWEPGLSPRQTRCDTTDPVRARAACRELWPRSSLSPSRSTPGFSVSLAAVRLDPISIAVLAVGAAIRLETDGLEVAYHVYLPLNGSVELDLRTESVTADPTRAAVQRPTGAGAVLIPRGGRLLIVGVERSALENHLEQLSGQPAPSPIRLATSLDVAGGAGLTWARTVRLLASESADGLLWRSPMVEVMRPAVLTGLLLAVEHPHRHQLHRTHVPSRPRTVKRAIDAMLADPAHPFTTFDLAAIAGVGHRALQEGFRQHVGVSPMAYLRRLRLECAREHLRLRPPGVTVAEVARRCGFTNPGRFAAAYRVRYGVPPSRTPREKDGG
jgi:AraC-like DNA-binding protein